MLKPAASTPFKFKPSLMAGLYLVYWAAASLPHFHAAEHHHHEQKICHAAPGEKHLHSEEYQTTDCDLCQLVPASAEFVYFTYPPLYLSAPVSEGPLSDQSGRLSPFYCTIAQPRAPPCA